jgi:secreted PhoX family phosphatase
VELIKFQKIVGVWYFIISLTIRNALFVNIQHPGEGTPANSAATGGGGLAPEAAYGPAKRPRSATIVITRNDGGKVGV